MNSLSALVVSSSATIGDDVVCEQTTLLPSSGVRGVEGAVIGVHCWHKTQPN